MFKSFESNNQIQINSDCYRSMGATYIKLWMYTGGYLLPIKNENVAFRAKM